jgi:stage V sporulation protein SpoVS
LKYRVTDLRPEAEDAFDLLVDSARSPEHAAMQALGLEVVRSGTKANLIARVYWERIGQDELGVDLYLKPS